MTCDKCIELFFRLLICSFKNVSAHRGLFATVLYNKINNICYVYGIRYLANVNNIHDNNIHDSDNRDEILKT